MADHRRPKDKPDPRRPQFIQPDAPGRARAEPAADPKPHYASLDRALEQERTAVDNVRDV